MKRKLFIVIFSLVFHHSYSQNEGRVGIFAGINRTSLSNAKDKAAGDWMPTFKPSIGLEAGYYYTLFKKLPMGFNTQISYTQLGQNYNGDYADSTSFYAYSRLNYLRIGLGMHFGSNMRRQVAFTLDAGVNYGMLLNYQERYELIRYNNDRFILDAQNTDFNVYDTVSRVGTLTAPLYNKTDLTVYGALGLDFLLSKRIVFGFCGRMDMGMNTVENSATKINVNYNSNPPQTESFAPFNTPSKFRGPVDAKIKRDKTTNQYYGIYFSFKYRLFNEEKIEDWYKEHIFP